MQEASASLSRNYILSYKRNSELWSLWKGQCLGLTFVIGASIVIEWIRAIEECRRVCKLGAAIKESQRVSIRWQHLKSTDSWGTAQRNTASCPISPVSPCKSFTASFLVLVCLLGSHFSFLLSDFPSILHFRMVHALWLQWMSIKHYSSCKSVCVPHLGGTGALMKTMLPMSASLTTHRSRKKTLPPLSHTTKQSQMGSVEVLLSSNQQQ